MQVQIRLADSGRSSKLSRCETVAEVQQHIQRTFQIDPEDQLLITKFGMQLQPNERLDASNDQLRGTYVSDSETTKFIQVPCIYVFNEKTIRSSEATRSLSEEELVQNLNQKYANIASLRNRSEHRPLTEIRSKEQIARLQTVSEDIPLYANTLLEHHEEVLSLAHRFSMIRSNNEEISSMCQNQSKACNLLFKCVGHRSDNMSSWKKALVVNLEALAERFETKCRSVDELHKQPIPDKLECQRTHSINASVFDLCFDQQKHAETVKRINSNINSVRRRLDTMEKEVEGLSSRNKTNRMYEERKSMGNRYKVNTNESIQTAEHMKIMQLQVDMICKTAGDKYQMLLEAIKCFLRLSDDKNAGELHSMIKLSAEEKQFTETRNILLERIQSLTTIYISFNKQQRLNEGFLKETYKSCNRHQVSIENVEAELKKMDKELHSVNKDLQSIHFGKEVTDALALSMKEVGRRRQFVAKLEDIYNSMSQLLEQEQERRKKYISHRKKSKVEEVITILNSHSMPTVVLDLGNDKRLPKLDIGQTDEESDRTSRREADLKREISKLKQKLQRFEKSNEAQGINRALEEISQLTADINNYKRMKENISNNPENGLVDTKLSNMEGILTKTTKICHQLYSKKLKEEMKKNSERQQQLNDEISRLNGIVCDFDADNRKLKEEVRDLRVRLECDVKERDAIEGKKRSKVESADMSRTKDDQLKGAISQIGRYKEEVIKRDEQIKDLQRNVKSLVDNKKLLDSEVAMLQGDKKHLEEEIARSKGRIESLETNLKLLREEQKLLERKLHSSDEEKLRILAELRQHLHASSRVPTEEPASADKLQILEEENLHIREINEQLEIEFKCKEGSLLDRLQIEFDKLQAAEQRIVELSSNIRLLEDKLSSQNEMNTELKMMLGDKQIQLIVKDELINKLQSQKQDEEEQQEIQLAPERMELMRLREENSILRSDLENVENELNLIVMKETFEVETQTRENPTHQDDGFVDIGPVERGKRMLFIPYSTGIYLPLAMSDSHKTQYCLSNTTVMSYRSNYFLDMGSLEGKTRDFLNQCSLVMISKVDNIRERVTTHDDNPFGLKLNEPYFLVEVERPEFIVGFEDEDVSLKNYAYI